MAMHRNVKDGLAIAVAVCGRKGWNSEAGQECKRCKKRRWSTALQVVNGVYRQDGVLNGRARLRKSGELGRQCDATTTDVLR